MTTENRPGPRDRGPAILPRTACATAVVGVVLTVIAAIAGGTPAAYGAALGVGLLLLVFGFGTFTVDVVAAVMPPASLLVALLTYSLQLVVLTLALAVLAGSDLLDGTVARDWVGAAVIVCTLSWTFAQLVLSTSRRIPIYDLPEPRPTAASVSQGEG